MIAWSWACEELILKGHEGTFEGYRSVLYFDYSGGYTGVNTCQNSFRCIILSYIIHKLYCNEIDF